METRSFPRRISPALAALALFYATTSVIRADAVADAIGLTQLHIDAPGINGSGVIVAVPEGTTVDKGPPVVDHDNYQIGPSITGSILTSYIGKDGNFQAFNVAQESTLHGDFVGSYLVAAAPNLARIVNANANWFVNSRILSNQPLQFSPKIINQSFSEEESPPYTKAVLDQTWDSYVSKQGTVVVQAAGNGGAILIPGTAYNVITVGVYGGLSSASNPGELAKPDLVAPTKPGEEVSSYAVPSVTGIAALMVQAAGGSGAGADPRTVKAILLNGAVKPAGWTHTSAVPLDRSLGAGIVNAANSYHNLTAGQKAASSATLTANLDGAHLGVNAGVGVGLAGWNFSTITSSTIADAVQHYVIDLTQAAGPVSLTASLTWQRDKNTALTNEILASNANTTVFNTPVNTINNLDLFLYNVNTLSQVDLSNSAIDNVEHLYTLNLAPGIYDLQVLKHGGSTGTPNVYSDAETYALAWNVGGFTAAAVPEPTSLALMGMGMASLLVRRRKA